VAGSLLIRSLSGTKEERKGLTEALSHLREGDTLVVWRLDRLGRSLRHLIDTITALDERGVGFKSLTENIDTTTSGEKLVFHIFGALAEFEREIIRERTQAGLQSARSRGKIGGRPKALTPKEVQILRNMAADKSLTVSDICKTLGIGRTTFYRYVKAGERVIVTILTLLSLALIHSSAWRNCLEILSHGQGASPSNGSSQRR
jgi:DNA invertase Pin-like site-specific DNA recombinase